MKNEVKNLRNEIVLILLLLIGLSSTSFAQFGKTPKALISTDETVLRTKMDNALRIVAQQENPVTIDQLSATFQKDGSDRVPIKIKQAIGYFTINPDTIGIVEINISIGDTIETKTLRVKAIDAEGYLGNFQANSDEKMGVGIFKSQGRITASVYCCGIQGYCNVLGYQIIRINKMNRVERIINRGDYFQENTRLLINKAEAGDIYIFRQIKYKCPGTDKPQRLDDMILELE